MPRDSASKSAPKNDVMPNGAERCEASLQHKGQDLSPPQDLRYAPVLLRLEMTEVAGKVAQKVEISPNDPPIVP
jgi:hypothetical protein